MEMSRKYLRNVYKIYSKISGKLSKKCMEMSRKYLRNVPKNVKKNICKIVYT